LSIKLYPKNGFHKIDPWAGFFQDNRSETSTDTSANGGVTVCNSGPGPLSMTRYCYNVDIRIADRQNVTM
jgi:hypothetical protein